MSRGLHFVSKSKTRLTLLAVVALVALASAVGAIAYWTTAGSGSASANAGNLTAATISAPGTSSGSVLVSVTTQASMLPASQSPNITYMVERKLDAGAYAPISSGDCATLAYNDASCTDTVGTSGTYTYRVVAYYAGDSWTAPSNEVQVVANTDSAAPMTTITFPAQNGVYNSISYNAGCTPRGVCGSASDATGVDKVRVSVRQGATGPYWDGTAFGSFSEIFIDSTLLSPGTTISGWVLGLPLPADASYTVHVQARDTAGNDSAPTNTSTATFTIDAAAPAVTLIVPANNSFTSATTPTLSGAAGNASGDSATVSVKVYSGTGTGGPLLQTIPVSRSGTAWTTSAATLADGTYTAQASQTDSAGNIGTSNANSFTVDAIAPAGNYTFPASGGVYGTASWNAGCASSGFCGTASDAGSGIATVQIQIKNPSGQAWDGSIFRNGNRMVLATFNAGTWAYAFNASNFAVDGVYQINGTITDNVGNTVALASRSFTIDRVAPTVTLTAPINGARTANTNPTFSGAAGTATGDLPAITVKIYSGSTTGGTLVQTLNATASVAAWSIAASTALADGTYTAQAGQSDAAGNTANSNANTFVVDTTAPAVTVTAPAAASVTANQTPTLSGTAGTATGDLTAISVKVYNGTGTGGTIAQTLTPTASSGAWTTTAATLAAGTYTVQATQNDSAGNTGTSTAVTFTINISAPTITATPALKSANAAPSFSFSHSIYSSFQCSLDGAAFTACSSPKALSGLANGSHSFALRALDGGGNATQSASYTWTVDTSAPTISAKPANPSAATAPSFSFAQSSYTSYECSLDGAAFAGCASPKSYATADGAHTFAVKAIDADTVRTSAASYTWTQTATAPTITAKPQDPSANKTPVFSFSAAGYSSFQCSINGGGFTACTSGSAIASQADGARSFAVRAVDANSVTTSAGSYSWTINTIAPTITSAAGMTASGTYAATSAAFNFSHGIYTSFQCFLDANSSAVCANGKTFSALADGVHTVTATGRDGDNIPTSNGTFAWTVRNAAPTLTAQPANPTNTTSATFNFNETPYSLFQCQIDGGAFTACNAGTQNYPSLSGGPAATGASHTFNVHAVDSLAAATLDRSYTWTVDTVAPTPVTATTCTATGNTNNRKLTSAAGGAGSATTDSTTVSLKIFNGTGIGGTVFQVGLTGSRTGSTWALNGSSNTLTSLSTYTLQATQADNAGNSTVGTTVCTFTA